MAQPLDRSRPSGPQRGHPIPSYREQEVERQRSSLSLKFIFNPRGPGRLGGDRSMGIVITYLQVDRRW